MKIACIVTAAGNSIRFGADKLTYQIDGKPMIEHPLELLNGIGFCKSVIVSQPHKSVIRELAYKYGFVFVSNDRPDEGIAYSVVLGVKEALSDNPDGILFCVADQPNLRKNSIEMLIDCFIKNSDRIVRLASNGRVGNPIIYPKATFDDLLQLKGDVGGSVVIDKYPERLYICNVAQPNELIDVDTITEADHVRD